MFDKLNLPGTKTAIGHALVKAQAEKAVQAVNNPRQLAKRPELAAPYGTSREPANGDIYDMVHRIKGAG